MIIHQNNFMYTPTRNFISQLYICKRLRKITLLITQLKDTGLKKKLSSNL